MNFEPFSGNDKPVERPESRVEQEISREEAQEDAKNEMRGGPPTRCAAPE